MRVIFAGTPVFAATALEALLNAGHEVVLVLTQPDRPAGRGMSLKPSPVKALALAHGIEVFQPTTLKDLVAQERLRALGADVMVVAAYGLILPSAVLGLPAYGCINIHASLLPRWRGAAPIQRALLAGDTQTGVAIMQMEAGLDTGPVLRSEAIPITVDDTTGSLHDRLADLGGRLLVATLGALPMNAVAQPVDGVTYAAKIEKSEALIDWSLPAEELDRKVRAFSPAPGAAFVLDGVLVKVWRAELDSSASGAPGTILAVGRDAVQVACGRGSLCLRELQRAGGKRLPVAQFLGGTPLAVGKELGAGA
ncbi:methionyl-tRNA formyltransferase [Rhodocyclus tenuis]|uniref:methionyl-tRNA formyltransferase n=1 Tax=Rhodocyclus gracilis TaxID=2929842 RepID=UPI001298C9A5|nr:methionyl-tRNA formyltransferase [Rhodocyclus gracilis]MRD73527.1 methionyl-tRNA formyltransferase [Rhodocyclus gracilis]